MPQGPHQRLRHQFGFQTGTSAKARTRENLGVCMHMLYDTQGGGTKIVIIGMKIKKGVVEVNVNALLPQWK